MSPASLKALEPRLQKEPAITYMAVNAKGDLIANVGPTDVNAVTWGVFPAKEVIQPTVVDPQSFTVWKVCTAVVSPVCGIENHHRRSGAQVQDKVPVLGFFYAII